MESGSISATKRSILNSVLRELSSSVRSPVYEYVRSNILYKEADLISALACAVQDTTDVRTSEQNERDVKDKYKLLFDNDDYDFHCLFKFRKDTLKELINVLEKRLTVSYDSAGCELTVSKKVLVTVWLLTSGKDYSHACDVFDIPCDSIVLVFLNVCSELTKLIGQFVKWPTGTEAAAIVDAFETQFGFPDVVGVIGCTTFKISRPLQDKEANHFYNPASDHHSIAVQAVCDERLLLRDICAGYPSRRSPSEILRDSPLYSRLIDRMNPLLPPRTFILGNGLYPQLANLLTPYSPKGRGPLNETEESFNDLHSLVENTIQKCFGAMKSRFQILKYIDIPNPPKATQIVLATCVLHNFAIMFGDKL